MTLGKLTIQFLTKWLLKCLEIHRVPTNLCDFIRRLIVSWNITLEVRTDKGLEFIGPVDILRGILQGDSFCLTLFIMGLNLLLGIYGRQKDIKCLQSKKNSPIYCLWMT